MDLRKKLSALIVSGAVMANFAITTTAFASTGDVTSVLTNASAGSTVTLTGTCTGTARITMSKNGVTVNSSGAVLNGSGIVISGSSNKINYLTITNSPSVGLWISGSSGNTITGCETRYAGDMGYACMYSGASGNTFSGCNAKYSYDSAGNGGNADGFGNKFSCGGNTWTNCYAYNNSDDGWDGWNCGSGTNKLTSCTSEKNGFKTDGSTTSAMNGVGFKCGGTSATGSWSFTSCKALNNKTYGWKRNGTTGTITLSGCTSSGNPNGDAVGSGD